MGCCKNGASFCPCNWDCPKAPIDLRPRALPWGERFPGVPAELASPYRGQIFAAWEATALEFVAFLVDRSLLSEWPSEQREAVNATGFDAWYSPHDSVPTDGDETADPESIPTPA
jgi:hypothetical protein